MNTAIEIDLTRCGGVKPRLQKQLKEETKQNKKHNFQLINIIDNTKGLWAMGF